MNPDANYNLPPRVESAAPPALAEAGPQSSAPEQQYAARQEVAAQHPPQPPTISAAQAASSLQPVLAQAGLATSSATTPTLPVDDASTDFDKEYVLKAKKIVEQTANSPYEQNRQIAQVRADFMQKRFGKVIKLAD